MTPQEALAESINELDCIMGNGSHADDPVLGLDYGTADEWAEALIPELAERGFAIVRADDEFFHADPDAT